MKVIAYDPNLSVDMAWRLDGRKISRVDDIRQIAQMSDYISIHVPFIKGVTENLIGDEFFMHMKVNESPYGDKRHNLQLQLNLQPILCVYKNFL